METVLALKFPGGRYHATPWGHHVNEGQVEWPPSPWRFLRALLATGFAKLGWPADGPPPVARSLLERLATALPRYFLPPAALAHTRHYVDAENKRPLIFDTWAHVGAAELRIAWDLALPAEERALLEAIVANLGYLGRAESWVEGELAEEMKGEANAFPVNGSVPGDEWETVGVIAPLAAPEYLSWREERIAAFLAATEPPQGKRMTPALKKERDKSLSPYPTDLIACLSAETRWLQGHGWNHPPGSREALYWVRAGALQVGPPIRRRPPGRPSAPFVLLALSTPTRATGALPRAERTLPRARMLHRAIASHAGRLRVPAATAATLLGRATRDATPEKGHTHAHCIHLDLDGDGHLDHVLVWAPAGLGTEAQAVLRSLRRTWAKGVGEIQIAFAGLGQREDLLDPGLFRGGVLGRILGGGVGATIWESETPFVPPRHLKERGRNSLVGQVLAELGSRGLPPCEVLPLGHDRLRRFRHFVLCDDRRAPPVQVALALRLRFPGPIPGPLCLGYGAHQGLGLFAAARNDRG